MKRKTTKKVLLTLLILTFVASMFGGTISAVSKFAASEPTTTEETQGNNETGSNKKVKGVSKGAIDNITSTTKSKGSTESSSTDTAASAKDAAGETEKEDTGINPADGIAPAALVIPTADRFVQLYFSARTNTTNVIEEWKYGETYYVDLWTYIYVNVAQDEQIDGLEMRIYLDGAYNSAYDKDYINVDSLGLNDNGLRYFTYANTTGYYSYEFDDDTNRWYMSFPNQWPFQK